MADSGNILIKGAQVNNLKNVDLVIPRGKFVVITGISGSGKSSLAFDTLFAEGQRRFAESLSSYARQFLGRMSKPDVEKIEGIPPAIAIEQKVNTRNPRSTIATSTEIYDYLRILFARIGRTYSPISGKEVKAHTSADVISYILGNPPTSDAPNNDSTSDTSNNDSTSDASNPSTSSVYILADLNWAKRDDKVELMLKLKEEGYSRFFTDKLIRIEEIMIKSETGDFPEELYLLIDRLKINEASHSDEDLLTRLHSSVTSAFDKGDGRIIVRKETSELIRIEKFVSMFEADGLIFHKPTEYQFSFNSPLGACPHCDGLGRVSGISEDLVIPDKSLSIYDNAIFCWRGEKMSWFKEQVIKNSYKYDFPIFEPYCNLTDIQKDILWNGRPGETEEESIIGLNDFFKWVESNKYKIQFKYMLSRYSGKAVCRECGGSRLRKDALYVKIGGKNIHELLCLNIEELYNFFQNLVLDENETKIAQKAIAEITSRLGYIMEVGLSYLTLNRASNTLSGGESQRINLVTALGSSLVGSLYVLDEPSIGLHSRDTQRLIAVLKRLRDMGNTLVVVEHDEEIIRAADLLIDIGPKAGIYGGEIVYKGTLKTGFNDENLNSKNESPRSLTLDYLLGHRPRYSREKKNWKYSITVNGAMENNLKNINVAFPLNVLTVVSGVSGSGKSSLVGNVLYPALYRHINQSGPLPGIFKGLSGDISKISQVEYVDQNPIGKSSRSNAVTYLKIYDDIRKLFSEQQYARLNGYTPSHFSFNIDGGRCPECQGEGFVKISMQFMADVKMVCESCGGKRFKPDILEVKYKDKSIDDILNMSVEEAIDFYSNISDSTAKRIVDKLQSLVNVGLSYIKLGQSSSTLSGGESQRVKLAYFLSNSDTATSRAKAQNILFIFDEPTTGLHFYDVEKLLQSFDALLAKGHTILVVEHNMDVIKAADWVIDLGPDAGDAGGHIVYEGSPEQMKLSSKTLTASFL